MISRSPCRAKAPQSQTLTTIHERSDYSPLSLALQIFRSLQKVRVAAAQPMHAAAAIQARTAAPGWKPLNKKKLSARPAWRGGHPHDMFNIPSNIIYLFLFNGFCFHIATFIFRCKERISSGRAVPPTVPGLPDRGFFFSIQNVSLERQSGIVLFCNRKIHFHSAELKPGQIHRKASDWYLQKHIS